MILNNLKTSYIGRNLVCYESIDSTQKEAWRLIKKNVPNGSLIISNKQTAGIGTHGRTWYTGDSENIAFSIVLYPECNVNKLKNITIDITEIIIQTFKKLYDIELSIKYPNDIVSNGKKIGGILTETKLCGESVKYLVIGIGINLKQEIFEEDIAEIATSIKNEFGILTDKFEIITEICNMLEDNIMNI